MKKSVDSTSRLLSLSLGSFAAAVLVPKLPHLLHTASASGIKALKIQCGLLLAWRLSLLRQKVKTEIPESIVAICAVASLLINKVLINRGQQGLGETILRYVLTFGALPSLNEAVNNGMESLLSGEADVPALLALQLGLALNYTKAGMIILIMLTGGEAIEDYALNRAGNDLHSLLEKSPGLSHRRISKHDFGDDKGVICEDVNTESVEKDEVLLVKSDEVIPIDGLLLSFAVKDGVGATDESLLTGETTYALKTEGDKVFGGTRNRGSPFFMKTTATYSNSLFALMTSQLQNALEKKGNLELASKKFTAIFTPITLATAALSWIIGYYKDSLRSQQLWERVLSVLMSATPCPAGIGVPIALLSGMSIATKKLGVTVKSGAALENIARTSTVVFDKTGTLTVGNPSVKSFHVIKRSLDPDANISDDEIVRLLASAEVLSSHPLAKAIVNYHKAESNLPLFPNSKTVHHNGAGLSAVIAGYQVHIGLRDYFTRSGIASSYQCEEDGEVRNHISSFFKIEMPNDGGFVEGYIYFRDAIRPSAFPLVKKLKDSGLRLVILSGDRSAHLKKVAEELGIREYFSCWPHEKARHIQRLKQEGERVLMVGDGSNDSAALAAADVGLAIGAIQVAAESADVVLMNDDLRNIGKLIDTGARVVGIAKRTVQYGMSASLLQMAVACAGMTTPFASACAQECIDLGAVLYALRALFLQSE